jgi:hypothetical protein
LAIISDRQLDFSLLGEIRDTLSESDLPMKVDVLDWARVAENFRKMIRSQYEIIQQGQGVQ